MSSVVKSSKWDRVYNVINEQNLVNVQNSIYKLYPLSEIIPNFNIKVICGELPSEVLVSFRTLLNNPHREDLINDGLYNTVKNNNKWQKYRINLYGDEITSCGEVIDQVVWKLFKEGKLGHPSYKFKQNDGLQEAIVIVFPRSHGLNQPQNLDLLL